MVPWGLGVPRCEKRTQVPVEKVGSTWQKAETRRTTVTCRPRLTWPGDHRMSEIHELAQR